MQEEMGFCFIFWLLSIKDEDSLGILNQKIRGAVTFFWVQIMRNEKRTVAISLITQSQTNIFFFGLYANHEIAGPN